MTEQLFFDTDCVSSFLWVGRENILLSLYPSMIILPQQVFSELSNPCIPRMSFKPIVKELWAFLSLQRLYHLKEFLVAAHIVIHDAACGDFIEQFLCA